MLKVSNIQQYYGGSHILRDVSLSAELGQVTVLPWDRAAQPAGLATLQPADVWIEAFGCELPEAFVAHGVRHCATAQGKQQSERTPCQP